MNKVYWSIMLSSWHIFHAYGMTFIPCDLIVANVNAKRDTCGR